MSRAEITYAEVATVADLLVSESETPSAKSIKSKFGDECSLGSIQKHLSTWREARQAMTPPRAIELSPEMQGVWVREVERQVELAKADSEANVAMLAEELNDMATEVERLDEDRRNIAKNYEELQQEVEDLQEQLKLQREENSKQTEELALEKKSAENGRISLVKEQLKLDGLKEQQEVLRGQLLESERLVTEAGNAKSDAKRKQFETEKLLAVEESKVEGLNEQNQLKHDQIQRLELEKDSMKQQLNNLEKELREALQSQKNAEIQAAASEGRVKHLSEVQEELVLAKSEIKELKKDNQKIREMLNTSYMSKP